VARAFFRISRARLTARAAMRRASAEGYRFFLLSAEEPGPAVTRTPPMSAYHFLEDSVGAPL